MSCPDFLAEVLRWECSVGKGVGYGTIHCAVSDTGIRDATSRIELMFFFSFQLHHLVAKRLNPSWSR